MKNLHAGSQLVPEVVFVALRILSGILLALAFQCQFARAGPPKGMEDIPVEPAQKFILSRGCLHALADWGTRKWYFGKNGKIMTIPTTAASSFTERAHIWTFAVSQDTVILMHASKDSGIWPSRYQVTFELLRYDDLTSDWGSKKRVFPTHSYEGETYGVTRLPLENPLLTHLDAELRKSVEGREDYCADLGLDENAIWQVIFHDERLSVWQHAYAEERTDAESPADEMRSAASGLDWLRVTTFPMGESPEFLRLFLMSDRGIVLVTERYLLESGPLHMEKESPADGFDQFDLLRAERILSGPGHLAERLMGEPTYQFAAIYQLPFRPSRVLQDADENRIYMMDDDRVFLYEANPENPRRVLRYVDALPPHIEPLFEAAVGYRDQGTGEQP